jgi:hypothetical protein
MNDLDFNSPELPDELPDELGEIGQQLKSDADFISARFPGSKESLLAALKLSVASPVFDESLYVEKAASLLHQETKQRKHRAWRNGLTIASLGIAFVFGAGLSFILETQLSTGVNSSVGRVSVPSFSPSVTGFANIDTFGAVPVGLSTTDDKESRDKNVDKLGLTEPELELWMCSPKDAVCAGYDL